MNPEVLLSFSVGMNQIPAVKQFPAMVLLSVLKSQHVILMRVKILQFVPQILNVSREDVYALKGLNGVEPAVLVLVCYNF